MPSPRDVLRRGALRPAVPGWPARTAQQGDPPPDSVQIQHAPPQAVPNIRGGHALYTRLMRNHDRMRTRHV